MTFSETAKFMAVTVIASVLLLGANHANAGLVTYEFAGTVTSNALTVAGDGLFEGKGIGDGIDGSFTIDTDATLTNVGPGTKDYEGDFEVILDGTTYTVEEVHIVNSSPTFDTVQFDLEGSGSLLGVLALRWASGSVLGSLDIPPFLPLASFLDGTLFGFELSGGPIDEGTITSLSLVESGVPAPNTLGMIGLGLIGLSLNRRRNRLA